MLRADKGGSTQKDCSLAALDPTVGHTMDVLSRFISVQKHENCQQNTAKPSSNLKMCLSDIQTDGTNAAR